MARILLVDDDAAALATAGRALETDGHAVTALAAAQDALAAVSGGAAFDLLVTDLQMPGLDGSALAMRLRTRLARLPVLLISAHAADLEAAARALPDARLLTKPFTVEQLRSAVSEALR